MDRPTSSEPCAAVAVWKYLRRDDATGSLAITENRSQCTKPDGHKGTHETIDPRTGKAYEFY